MNSWTTHQVQTVKHLSLNASNQRQVTITVEHSFLIYSKLCLSSTNQVSSEFNLEIISRINQPSTQVTCIQVVIFKEQWRMPRAIKILDIYTWLKCVKFYPEVNDINFLIGEQFLWAGIEFYMSQSNSVMKSIILDFKECKGADRNVVCCVHFIFKLIEQYWHYCNNIYLDRICIQ